MLMLNLVLSTLLLVVTNLVAWRGRGLSQACLLAGFAGIFGLFCLPMIFLNALLVGLVGLVCLFIRPRPGAFLIGSLAATLVTYALMGSLAVAERRDYAQLREIYPFESMADRLAYETRARQAPAAAPQEAGVPAQPGAGGRPALADRLAAFEDRVASDWRAQMRARSLRHLHESHVQQFIDSPGFGVSRVPRPGKYFLPIEGTEPIPLRAASAPPANAPADQREVPPFSAARADHFGTDLPTDARLRGMHDESLLDFVNPRGFGYVKDREHVAGFQPHQFRDRPQLGPSPHEGSRWLLDNLLLVSLLKHDRPAVYLSEHLPRMDELRAAKTRPLDAFEAAELPSLRRGEDLRVHYTTNHIRMLGSIRATKSCLSCHQAEQGDLLGAFSYQLRRDPLLP
ncbi:MAG: hypothetical protein L0Z62_07605 [Gemmataceae bacterium]|nr:hypothetical protein [Gemmataceae bacterium]